ncbi:hypothetical protein HAX54_011299, partial [Datura stramonium]|nr:hypothetical protein [Datura stramonium]
GNCGVRLEKRKCSSKNHYTNAREKIESWELKEGERCFTGETPVAIHESPVRRRLQLNSHALESTKHRYPPAAVGLAQAK